MNNTNKQIPKPREVLIATQGLSVNKKSAIEEYARQIIKYTLEQAAEKAEWTSESFECSFGHSQGYDFIDTDYAGDPSTGYKVSVDKQSILSLESQITKDLGL